MSIKIHTGFAFTGSSLDETVVLVGAQRDAIQDLVDRKNCRALARACAAIADAFCLARAGLLLDTEPEKHMKETPFGYALTTVLQLQQESRETLRRNPQNDCDVLLRLFYDNESRKVFGMVVEEAVGVLEHLLAQPGIVPFSYFDNMERPDSVAEAEWELRGALWGRVGDKSAGFEFSMSWQPRLPCLSEVAPYVASFDERVQRMANRLTENAYVAENWKPPSPGSMAGVYKVLCDSRQAIADVGNPWHDWFHINMTEVRSHLVPNLSSMLDVPLGEFPHR